MAKKMSKKDVQTIFECISQNKPPPPSLTFQIILANTDGLKISPPSCEFENGLYVLLRLQNGRIPSKLEHLISRIKSEKGCYWRLSGPQNPMPTKVQHRYCYPKGDQEYSSNRGAMLWTMVDENGEENVECRLLHVYSSSKKLSNQQNLDSSETKRKKLEALETIQSNNILISPDPYILTVPKVTNVGACESFRKNCSSFTGHLFSSPPPNNYYDGQLISDSFSFKIPGDGKHLNIMNNPDDKNEKQSDRMPMSEPIPINENYEKNKEQMSLEDRGKNLQKSLHMIHSEFKADFTELPLSEQVHCLAYLVSWAKHIASNPNCSFSPDDENKKDNS